MHINATIAGSLLIMSLGAAPGSAPAPQVKSGAPKFKAVWEPVPFTKDVNLNAVACVGPQSCFVVGAKSTILFTADAGAHWEVQLGGDPESTDEDLSTVFFHNEKNGWAMSRSGKVLGTRDGRTWAELSTVSGTSRGLWFWTPESGVEFENPDSTTQSTIQRSTDGGKTWKPEHRCSVDASVGGLPRKLECRLNSADFLSPTVGFVGGSAVLDMATNVATFGKTTDGGQTWATTVIPETKRHVTDITFWSEKDGMVVLEDGEELYWTDNGGATWTRSVKQRQWPSVYGVGEGRIIVGIGEGGGIGYSFNGGRTFTSRPFTLPARAQDVTFPDAQHGYLVGDHAMVYRYRIVPIEVATPGGIAAMAP